VVLYQPVFPLLLNQLEQDIELSIPGSCPAHTLLACTRVAIKFARIVFILKLRPGQLVYGPPVSYEEPPLLHVYF
jgi:hypothetical protein